MKRGTMPIDYFEVGDLVWVMPSGFAPTIMPPEKMCTRGIILKVDHRHSWSANQVWYDVLQTTPLGKTEKRHYPSEMLLKIDKND